MENKPYKPVACEFIDHIEIFATRRQRVKLVYLQDTNRVEVDTVLKTWYTKEGIEYLEMSTPPHHIRLDHIIQINDIESGPSCSI